MSLLGIIFLICFVVLIFALVQYLKIKAIYLDLADFRKFMANESLVLEGKINEVKHEVKGLKHPDTKINDLMHYVDVAMDERMRTETVLINRIAILDSRLTKLEGGNCSPPPFSISPSLQETLETDR